MALSVSIKMQLLINVTLSTLDSKDEIFVILLTNSCQDPCLAGQNTRGLEQHNILLSIFSIEL